MLGEEARLGAGLGHRAAEGEAGGRGRGRHDERTGGGESKF